MHWLVRALLVAIRAGVLLLPEAFRRRFGRDVTATAIDVVAARHADGGAWRALVAAAAELRGLAALAWTERRRVRRTRPAEPAWRGCGAVADAFGSALRRLRREPMYASAVVGTLAVATGATVAVFALTSAVLLKPLPFAAADRLAVIWEAVDAPVPGPFRVTAATYRDWAAGSRTFEALAAFGAAALTWRNGTEAEALRGLRVTANFFDVLGVPPLAGRAFVDADGDAASPQVVILSEALWRRRFGGRPDAVGGAVRLNDESYTVIGVMPSHLYPGWPMNPASLDLSPELQHFWIPVRRTAAWTTSRRAHVLGVVGRLRADATLEAARAEIDRLTHAIAAAHPGSTSTRGVVRPLHEEMTTDARLPLGLLMGAALVMWLLTCVNLAAFVLARTTRRRQEFAVRGALGASRAKVCGHVFSEALVLSVGGVAAGLLMAASLADVVAGLVPATIPIVNAPRLDGRVLAFSGVAALWAAGLLGVVPLGAIARGSWREAGVASGRTVVAPGGLQRMLVVAQVAMAVTLTVGAILLLRSVGRLSAQATGIVTTRLLMADVAAPQPARADRLAVASFERRLLTAVRGVNGVVSAAVAYDRPLESTWSDGFSLSGDTPDRRDDEGRSAWLQIVSPGYVDTVGANVVAGRFFGPGDTAGRPGVAVVNESFVRAFSGGRSILGRVLDTAAPSYAWGDRVPSRFEIVGVVSDIRFRGVDHPPEPAFYLSTEQFPQASLTLLVRTAPAPGALVQAIRAAVAGALPGVPMASVSTAEEALRLQMVTRVAARNLVALFGSIAAAIAALGLYVLLTLDVAGRRREFGLRLALGAEPRALERRVLMRGLRLMAGGVAIGTALAGVLMQAIRPLIFEVPVLDPLSFASAAAGFGVVGLVAGYWPARRAARVDPVVSLRAE